MAHWSDTVGCYGRPCALILPVYDVVIGTQGVRGLGTGMRARDIRDKLREP